MSAFKVICSECNKEEIFINKNTYTGRSPRSVAKREKQRHIRNKDHASESTIEIEQGRWDNWSSEFRSID